MVKGSFIFSPILKGKQGDVGPKITSTFSKAFSKSFFIKVLYL